MFQRLARQLRNGGALGGGPVGIETVRRGTELHRALVALVVFRQVRDELRPFADSQDKQPCRHRIERAGVSDAPRLERTPSARDDVV
jgi:hypothetical protein